MWLRLGSGKIYCKAIIISIMEYVRLFRHLVIELPLSRARIRSQEASGGSSLLRSADCADCWDARLPLPDGVDSGASPPADV